MACRKLDRARFEAEYAQQAGRRRYIPEKDGRSSVPFRFNLDPAQTGRAILLVYSNRLRSSVYWGPYEKRLLIEIDARLREGSKGWDNIEFRLLRFDENELCVWGNDRGYPYWSSGAEVRIDFLDDTVMDEDGLVKQHEVRIG